MRGVGKSSLYRHEVRYAAIEALVEAIERIVDDESLALPSAVRSTAPRGRARPLMTQTVRTIDWDADSTDTVIRKIRAGEGHPGVLDTLIRGTEFYLFGAHREQVLRGQAGEIIARRTGAICRATVDGAVWITHLKRRDTATERNFKLPAVRALALAGLDSTLRRSRSRSLVARARTTPTARSPMPRTPLSATCTSTSTTAR